IPVEPLVPLPGVLARDRRLAAGRHPADQHDFLACVLFCHGESLGSASELLPGLAPQRDVVTKYDRNNIESRGRHKKVGRDSAGGSEGHPRLMGDTMDSEQAFLEALGANPNDDVTRLVYADWLEERGDLRAEFPRVESALAGLSAQDQGHAGLLARLRE